MNCHPCVHRVFRVSEREIKHKKAIAFSKSTSNWIIIVSFSHNKLQLMKTN